MLIDSSMLSIQTSITLKFKVGLWSVKEDNNLLHLFSVGMEEIFEKVGDRFISDVAAHHDMSHSLILERSSVLGSISQQLHNLGDSAGKHGQAHSQKQHLEAFAQGCDAGDVTITWHNRIMKTCVKTQRFETFTDSGHGYHEEVYTVPVGQILAIVKVWRVPWVLQQVNNSWNWIKYSIQRQSR